MTTATEPISVLSDPGVLVTGPGYDVPGTVERYRDTFNRTLRDELNRDADVFIMGEDISGGFDRDTLEPLDAWGGPFAATKGLVQDFGPERIRDAPISEAGFVGAAVGAALTGLRPVVDLMYFDFVTVAYDQLLSNAAKSRYMFGGQTKVPLTLFARSGGGTGHAAQHSESFYSMLAHIPGLKVVVPSDPYTVRGLLAAAIRDDDPVFLVNDKKLINTVGFAPEESFEFPLGKGRYLKHGDDVTLDRDVLHLGCMQASSRRARRTGYRCGSRRHAQPFAVRRGDHRRVGQEDQPRRNRRRGHTARQHGFGVRRDHCRQSVRLLGRTSQARHRPAHPSAIQQRPRNRLHAPAR